jgi:hypothetical protein
MGREQVRLPIVQFVDDARTLINGGYKSGALFSVKLLKFRVLTAHNRQDYEGQKGKSINVNY